MNLREKLGQRFIYRLPGVTRLTPEVADFLVESRAGGVVLFGYNVETPRQLALLNRELQALAVKKGLPPFIISVDEEGGQVSRMPAEEQDLILPSQMALAGAGPEAVRVGAGVNARRLRQLGFNLNYAPVLDINNNWANPVIGTRSFADEPHTVAELGVVALDAYLAEGISPCAKHFPGHGDTNVDSHFQLPVVDKSLDELLKFELVPFQRAVAARIPAIMTAHILYPQIETGGLPATLSPKFLTRLLRRRMGFEGLIFTDALDMRAIADRWGLGTASIMALQAGADVVMSFRLTFEEQLAGFEEVLAAAQSGELNLADLDAATVRLADWRARFCLPPLDTPTPAEDFQAVAQIARQGLKPLHLSKELLPLSGTAFKRPLLINFTARIESPVEEGRLPGPLFEQELRVGLPNVLRLDIGAEPEPAELERARAWACQSDLLIVVTRNAARFEEQSKLIELFLQTLQNSVPVIVVAARDPYDLTRFEGAAGLIATYGDPPATIKALANLLIQG